MRVKRELRKDLRIAYFLLVHQHPEQVSRLMERIYSPSDFFYIHKDRKTPFDGWENLFRENRGENVLFTSKYRIGWGYFNMIEAALDGMNWFRRFDYDYFINLSGQCYPIKPIRVIKEELEKKSVAYMEYFKLPYEDWGGLDRIKYIYSHPWGRSIRIPRLKKALPYNLEPYGGNWFLFLPKRFVDYILDYVSSHPKIVRFYKYSSHPDEMFFQTIIMNSPLKSEVFNDHRRYFRWDLYNAKNARTRGLLGVKQFNEIMQSDRLIAKKFDMTIDKDILDLIDKEILGLSS